MRPGGWCRWTPPLHGAPWQPAVLLAGMLEIVPGLTARRVSGQDFSFIPFAWTLRVEFAFYLVAAGTCWIMRWRGTGSRFWQLVTVAFVSGAAYMAFAAFAWRHWGSAGDSAALQVICVPFFAFGLSLFLLGRAPGTASLLHLLLVSAGVMLGFTFWGQRGHPVPAYQLPLLCALFAAMAVLSRAGPLPASMSLWDRRLGELSYPLYVGHGVVLSLLAGLSARRGALPYLAAPVLALLLALCLHAAVEQPLRALRARLRGVRL